MSVLNDVCMKIVRMASRPEFIEIPPYDYFRLASELEHMRGAAGLPFYRDSKYRGILVMGVPVLCTDRRVGAGLGPVHQVLIDA